MSDSETLLEATVFTVVRTHHATAGGKQLTREIVRHPGAVAIVPVLDDGRIVLIRNWRVAVDERLVELPAGTLEPGEDPRETAGRELAEETGYRARSIERLTTFYTSPGILDEKMHLFLATGLAPGPTDFQGGEDIESLPVTWEEAHQMLGDGRIRDAKTIVGLLFWRAFHPKR